MINKIRRIRCHVYNVMGCNCFRLTLLYTLYYLCYRIRTFAFIRTLCIEAIVTFILSGKITKITFCFCS